MLRILLLFLFAPFFSFAQKGSISFVSNKDTAVKFSANLPLEAEIYTVQKNSPFFLILSANDSIITALSLLQNYDTNALKRADYERRVKQLDSLTIKVQATDSLSKEGKEKRISEWRMSLAYKDTIRIRVKDVKKITFDRNNYTKREEVLAWSFTGASFLCAFAGLGELFTISNDSVSNTIPAAVGIPLFALGVTGSIISVIHLHRLYHQVIYMRKWRIYYHS